MGNFNDFGKPKPKIKFNFHRGIPTPKPTPKPELPFKEPEFKFLDEFITYCCIFDPTISTQSGKTMDHAAVLFADELYNRDSKIINLFNEFSDIGCAIQEVEDCVLFICNAPFYFEKPKEYSLKIIEDRFSKKPKLNTSWEKLRKSQVHCFKTYAHFRGSVDNETFQRWLVLKTPTKNIEYAESPEDMMGYGNTLPEADLEFHKARIKSFTDSQRTINYFIHKKVPLTKQRMFDTCKKIDPLVNPNSVTFSYDESGFSYIESSHFKLSCQSKTHKFTLNVFGGDITWEIVIILEVDDRNYPVNLEFIGEAETLEEALDICESRYQECINNHEQLDMMVSFKQHDEMQKEWMMDALEGEVLLNDLIAEFGEDIIPDRD
jgi:hypothetical protein